MPSRLLFSVVSLCALLVFSVNLRAQQGDLKDKPGVVQEETWREYEVPEAPLLSPEQALESFTVQEGFRLEILAAEPLVNDPVAIAWDEDGRLFAVEMWAYMPDVDGKGEDEKIGRVVVLEDIDQDGTMDKSTVYLDNLVLPRAISIVKGGVLIAEPNNLWFCQDTNKDLQCDRKEKVASYATNPSVEHSENGLLRNIDNWIYNARSSRRFKWNGEQLIEEQTAWRGQWGLSIDDYGRLYTANNSRPLLVDFYPFEFNNRNTGLESEVSKEQDPLENYRVYSSRVNTGVNRAYHSHTLLEDGRLNTATAASGPGVYRGDKYPEHYLNDVFFTEPSANLIGRLKMHELAIGVRAEHKLYNDPRWDKVDFLTSSDERFRPVNMATGPDGYLYIVDMYRGILQHKEFLTTFLRKQIIERSLDKPVGYGRIYRIIKDEDIGDHQVPKMSKFSEAKLVQSLTHENGWRRDTAQRLLTEKDSLKQSSINKLKSIVNGKDVKAAIHALWVLEYHDKIDIGLSLRGMQHEDHWVRIHSLRVSEKLFSLDDIDQSLVTQLVALLSDEHMSVRLQALQSLGAIQNTSLVIEHVAKLYQPDSNSPHFVDAAVSTLHQSEAAFIHNLLERKSYLEDGGRKQIVKKLIRALYVKSDAKSLLGIFELLNSQSDRKSKDWIATAIYESLIAVSQDNEVSRLTLVKEPKDYLEFVRSLDEKYAQGLEAAFDWPGKVVFNPLSALTKEEELSIGRGQELYAAYCASCHQHDGKGMASLAPPLSDSEWVNDSPKRLTLVIAQGLSGPISVNGQQWDGVMPAHGKIQALQGDALVDLINFLRSSWANQSGPVDANIVRNALQEFWSRTQAWTAEELENIGN
jgi:glucose/arabinose dehydrogenase/mono/diheme cytochrome c family protein